MWKPIFNWAYVVLTTVLSITHSFQFFGHLSNANYGRSVLSLILAVLFSYYTFMYWPTRLRRFFQRTTGTVMNFDDDRPRERVFQTEKVNWKKEGF